MASSVKREFIDLVSDSEDEAAGSKRPAHSRNASDEAAGSKRPALSVVPTNRNIPVASSSGKASVSNQALKNDEDDEDEVTLVGSRGQNALVDFPHARENCVTFPFSGNKLSHCPNCYCYCCDDQASNCPNWHQHCHASHSDRQWREERERAKLGVPTAASSTSTSSSSSSSSIDNRPSLPQYSIKALLHQVTAVYPVEIVPSLPFTTPLRHYQKQSVAFMIDAEQSTKDGMLTRGGFLADEVGMGKSACVIALVVANPALNGAQPTDETIRDHVAKYNKVETRRLQIEGDWRAENDQLETYTEYFRSQEKMQLSLPSRPEKLKVQTTVILTSVSLMGQWEDEVKKHAPGLTVKTFHNAKRGDGRIKFTQSALLTGVCEQLADIDIIISTATFKWPSSITNAFEFHRLVMDESHLFTTAKVSANEDFASKIPSGRRWCVTATPCTGAVHELHAQNRFLGCNRDGPLGEAIVAFQRIQNSRACGPSSDQAKKRAFYRLADELKKVMIRHTKAQQIGGSEALALPPSTTRTILLDMTADERRLATSSKSVGSIERFKSTGGGAFAIERTFGFNWNEPLRSDKFTGGLVMTKPRGQFTTKILNPAQISKINALLNDLRELRANEPRMRAVVFTQHLPIQDACVRGLMGDGFSVLQFSGSTSASKRDENIRKFQDRSDGRPTVFVITIRSGNVGITLTAASRVYLLEPCLDPSMEVQAAGRIHRLGQDRAVEVTKYAYNDSYESNIINLHKQVLAGRIAITNGRITPEAVRILAKGIRGAK